MRSDRGFTLLEVMMAVAIMGMGIVGALELFTGSLKLAGDADKQSQAVVLARALVDEELWRDLLEEGARTGTEGRFSWRVDTHPIDRELIGRDEDPNEGRDFNGELGLWLIDAEVSWETLSGGNKSVRLETARIGQVKE